MTPTRERAGREEPGVSDVAPTAASWPGPGDRQRRQDALARRRTLLARRVEGHQNEPEGVHDEAGLAGVMPMTLGTRTPVCEVVGRWSASSLGGGWTWSVMVDGGVVGPACLPGRRAWRGLLAHEASMHRRRGSRAQRRSAVVWRIPLSWLVERGPGLSQAPGGSRGFHDCIRHVRISFVNSLLLLVQSRRPLVAQVGAVVLPLGLAALLVPFRVTFAAPAAALLLVAVIVGVATVGDRVAGYLARRWPRFPSTSS